MPAERFFTSDPLLENTVASLQDEEFHHLIHVMRGKIGQEVELINGKGALAKATLKSIQKHTASLLIESVYEEKEPPHQLILAQALPRLPKLEYIIEKSVELGVTDLWLFPGTLSEKKEFSENQMDRIHHICLSAVKQCGRLFMPRISFKPSILTWSLNDLPSERYFGDTRSGAPTLLDSLKANPFNSFLIAIGPEKGFHEKETLHMEKTLLFKGVKLHPNILRAETAAIHALSLSSAFLFN